MKITDHCIVVLTEDGQFRNIPHRSSMPELGEQLVIDLQEQARRAVIWYRSKLVVAVASLLIIIATVLLSSNLTPSSATAAVVAIDINPSIELSVNNKGIVTQVDLINDDAEWSLSANDLVGKEIYAALAYVLQQAETHGYLNRTDKSDVWLSDVYLTEDAYWIDFDKLTQSYSQYEFHHLDGDPDQLKQAKQAELSLNKYLVYEMMKNQGIELELEELRSQPLRAVLQTHREEESTDDPNKHDPITTHEVYQPEVKEQQEAIVDEGEDKEKSKEKDHINQQSEHRSPSKDNKNDKRKDHREEDADQDDEKESGKDPDREDERERKSEHNAGYKSNLKQNDADKDDEGDGKKFDKKDRGRKDD